MKTVIQFFRIYLCLFWVLVTGCNRQPTVIGKDPVLTLSIRNIDRIDRSITATLTVSNPNPHRIIIPLLQSGTNGGFDCHGYVVYIRGPDQDLYLLEGLIGRQVSPWNAKFAYLEAGSNMEANLNLANAKWLSIYKDGCTFEDRSLHRPHIMDATGMYSVFVRMGEEYEHLPLSLRGHAWTGHAKSPTSYFEIVKQEGIKSENGAGSTNSSTAPIKTGQGEGMQESRPAGTSQPP